LTSLICDIILFFSGETNTALAGQLLFSLLAIAVNLGLVGGALGGRVPAIIVWLIFYMLNIIGSLGQ
jgi:hypothetical protein